MPTFMEMYTARQAQEAADQKRKLEAQTTIATEVNIEPSVVQQPIEQFRPHMRKRISLSERFGIYARGFTPAPSPQSAVKSCSNLSVAEQTARMDKARNPSRRVQVELVDRSDAFPHSKAARYHRIATMPLATQNQAVPVAPFEASENRGGGGECDTMSPTDSGDELEFVDEGADEEENYA